MAGLAVPVMIVVTLMSAGWEPSIMEKADAPWQMRLKVIEVQIDYFSFIPHEMRERW
jgi:hypothetical protein